MEEELRQRLERIEGFAWATMVGLREMSPEARRSIDNALILVQKINEQPPSESGAESTCETTGEGSGDEHD